MSFAKSKNEFSKRDMNFFSEFSSAASQQFSSAFPFFLLTALAIIIITLLVWVICGIQIMNKTKEINSLRETMASADYQARLAAKDESQAAVEKLREYYYAISTLDAAVTGTTTSSVETLVGVIDSLPNDTVITKYEDKDGTVTIQGFSLDRTSPVNFANLLRSKDLFSFVTDSIKAADPNELGLDNMSMMYSMMKYQFEFKCTIKGHYTVSWASFVDGTSPAALSQLRTMTYNAGSDFSIPDIAVIEDNGVTYNLTNIRINGVAVSQTELDEAVRNNQLTGKVSTNMNIEFIYTPAAAEAAQG
ncbi:MAG: hypothetical protein J6Y08_04460 [Clostridiales bacterium]|nr:hypothetical protein [Clostridiales bacterium]